MSRSKKYDSGRMAGGFSAVPWVVQDSEAYKKLSHQARSLLMEFARQLDPKGAQNGQLIATGRYLRKRGWSTSNDTATKAKRELLEGGFIYETVMGHRPNKASWYAVTWHRLAPHDDYDTGAERGFKRGAFMGGQPLPKPKPTRQELYRKWDKQNASLTPPDGVGAATIAPPHGVEAPATAPPHGAMKPVSGPPPTPPHGDHIDIAMLSPHIPASENKANVRAAQIAPAWALRGMELNSDKRLMAVAKLMGKQTKAYA